MPLIKGFAIKQPITLRNVLQQGRTAIRLFKLMFLAMHNIAKRWTPPLKEQQAFDAVFWEKLAL